MLDESWNRIALTGLIHMRKALDQRLKVGNRPYKPHVIVTVACKAVFTKGRDNISGFAGGEN